MKSKVIIVILTIGFVVFALMSFHFIIDDFKIVPKENLSFKNTFISDEDISNYLERYNSSSNSERKILLNDPLHKLLVEVGRIYKKSEYNEANLNSNTISENNSNDLLNKAIISVDKAIIYNSANINTQTKSYLIQNDEIEILYTENGYINFRYYNSKGKEIVGWINENDTRRQ